MPALATISIQTIQKKRQQQMSPNLSERSGTPTSDDVKDKKSETGYLGLQAYKLTNLQAYKDTLPAGKTIARCSTARHW